MQLPSNNGMQPTRKKRRAADAGRWAAKWHATLSYPCQILIPYETLCRAQLFPAYDDFIHRGPIDSIS
jgi:hypothetical protein